ncbi:MAG TPA: hypothetical protein VNZ26_05435 [Vicinamibacterales bacterium]|nr:hypothetical protein [Vicinamibacterales bacterium]
MSYEAQLQSLKRTVAGMARSGRVAAFKIGRTVDMEDRNAGHRADEIMCLAETTSVGRVMDLEDDLIKHFWSHPKNVNEADHSGGNVADGRQHLYVAVWRRRSRPAPRRRDPDALAVVGTVVGAVAVAGLAAWALDALFTPKCRSQDATSTGFGVPPSGSGASF